MSKEAATVTKLPKGNANLYGTLRTRIKKELGRGVETPEAKGKGWFRVRLGKATLAYVNAPNKKGIVRVELKAGAPESVKVTDEATLETALAGIVARAKEAAKAAEAPKAAAGK